MGVNVFPAASGGASYSSQPPASASSVLLDGQLVTASSITTSVTGTGAPWLLYANGAGSTTITIAGTNYIVPAGSTVGTSAYTGSKSVTVSTTIIPPATFAASIMPSSSAWSGLAYGLLSSTPTYVAVASGTTNAAYSTNATTWTASTMPSTNQWTAIAFGNGYFVAVGVGKGAYSTNGITWTTFTSLNSNTYGTITFGNSYFVTAAGAGSATTVGAYSSTSSPLPLAYGIYNGATVRA